MTPHRFDIVLVNLDPVIGSEMAKKRPAVVVCPLTTKLHPGWRSRVQITSVGKRAEIAVDQIRAVSKRRIVRRLGKITAKSAAELQRAISEMYGEG